MRKKARSILAVCLLLAGIFTLAPQALASSLVTQEPPTDYTRSFGLSFLFASNSSFSSPGVTFGSTGKLVRGSLYMKTTGVNLSNCGGSEFTIQATDASLHDYTSDPISYSSLSIDGGLINFTFSPSEQLNFASTSLYAISTQVNCNTQYGELFGYVTQLGQQSWGWSQGNGDANKAFAGSLYDTAGNNLEGNFVEFADPPFTPGFASPDFQNWQACFNLVSGNGTGSNPPTTLGYYYAVSYGTSSTSLTTQIFPPSGYGYISAPSLPFYACNTFAKSSTTTPDDYIAQVGLYYHSLSGTEVWYASSSFLSYTIISGNSVALPNLIPAPEVTCDFEVSNTGVSTVDNTVNGIVNGICKALTYLFVPDNNQFSRFSGIWDVIKRKPPFGWFTVTNDEFTNLSTTTPISSVTSSTPPNISGVAWIITPADIALASLVTFSFLFFLFHRLRKIDI